MSIVYTTKWLTAQGLYSEVFLHDLLTHFLKIIIYMNSLGSKKYFVQLIVF